MTGWERNHFGGPEKLHRIFCEVNDDDLKKKKKKISRVKKKKFFFTSPEGTKSRHWNEILSTPMINGKGVAEAYSIIV
jgi:hypothetical protein